MADASRQVWRIRVAFDVWPGDDDNDKCGDMRNYCMWRRHCDFFSSLHRYIRFEWGVRRGLRFFFKNPNYFCPTKNGMMFYEHWTNQQNLDSNLAKTFFIFYFIDLVSIDCQLICRQHNLLRHLELVWLVSILARNNK